MPKVQSLDHLVLTVADVAATATFYADVLGMQVYEFAAADGTRRTALGYGQQKINLHPAASPFDPKAAKPTPGSADLCFLTDAPMDHWQDHFARQGITIVDGPIQRTGATGPIMSLYVRDPDGNLIEVSQPIR